MGPRRRTFGACLVSALLIAACGAAPASPTVTSTATPVASFDHDAASAAFFRGVDEGYGDFHLDIDAAMKVGAATSTVEIDVVSSGEDSSATISIHLDEPPTDLVIESVMVGDRSFSRIDGGPWSELAEMPDAGVAPDFVSVLTPADMVASGSTTLDGETVGRYRVTRAFALDPAQLGTAILQSADRIDVTAMELWLDRAGRPRQILATVSVSGTLNATMEYLMVYSRWGEPSTITAPVVDPVLRIVLSAPLQGDRSVSSAIANAAQLAIEQRDGVIGQWTIELVQLDGGDTMGNADLQAEARNVAAAVQDASVVAYFGPVDSMAVGQSIPATCRAGLAHITPTATYPGLTKPVPGDPEEPGIYYPDCRSTFFRNVTHDGSVGPAMAHVALGDDLRRAWLITSEASFGTVMAETFTEAFEADGGTVLGTSLVGADDTPTSDEIAAIGSAEPDVVILATFAGPSTHAWWRSIRAELPDVRFVSNDTIWNETFLAEVGDAGVGTLMLTPTIPPELYEHAGSFEDDYENRFGEAAPFYAAYGYDAMKTILGALDRATETLDTPAQIRKALPVFMRQTEEIATTVGILAFDADGDLRDQSLGVFEISDAQGTVIADKVLTLPD